MEEKLIKQSIPFYHYLLLILSFIGFYSCEYDSNDLNYVHLEKPKDQIQLGIDLYGLNPTELIYLYNNSPLSYTLNTEGKEVLLLQFFLNGIPIESNQESGTVYLNKEVSYNEIHELKLIIGLKTGTGSLAEYTNYEMYVGEYNFKIKIIPYSNSLNIKQTTNSKNNLKLEWDKPLNYEISGYSIYKGDSMHGVLLAKISNPNETFFVDTDYAYGYRNYTVVAEIKNSYNLSVEDHLSVNFSNIEDKDFETKRISTNEILVKWKNPNPYPSKYVLTYGYDSKIIIQQGVNEAIIAASDFPTNSESFTLYIVPEEADISLYDHYSYAYGSHSDKNFRAISFSVNHMNRMLHALNFNYLDNYDISTMVKTSSINHNLTLDTGCKVQASNDGRIAIEDQNGFVHVYSDYSLKNKVTKIEAGSYPFRIINNDKLLIEERNGFKLYDITNNNVITSKLWYSDIKYGEIVSKTTISSDGKYVYVLCWEYGSGNYSKQWVELYEIKADNNLKLMETINNTTIESIFFHPTKTNVAIFNYSPYNENKFVIIDFLKKEKKEIKGEFMNIDPFTGNILFRGEEYQNEHNVYVRDKDYENEIIKFKLSGTNSWSPSSLYNNNFYFSGHYVELNKLKEWKP